jgi:hypothetical protein
MSLAASKRASELEKSLNAWEENRLLTSGVVRLKQVRGAGRTVACCARLARSWRRGSRCSTAVTAIV